MDFLTALLLANTRHTHATRVMGLCDGTVDCVNGFDESQCGGVDIKMVVSFRFISYVNAAHSTSVFSIDFMKRSEMKIIMDDNTCTMIM